MRGDVEGDQNETFEGKTLIRYGGGDHVVNGMRIREEVDWNKSVSRGPTKSRGETPDTRPLVWNSLGRPKHPPCK